jgi:uncharacterized protein DUF3303
MLFVILGKAKAGSTTKQRVARRIKWKHPAGIRVLGEYWLQTDDPSVIMIAEADDVGSLLMGTADWDDFVHTTVVPAMTAEQGLKLAKQMLEKTAP